MGGKRLKFPARQKYVPPVPKKEEEKEEEVSQEEHEKRMKILKDMGILKE